MTISSKLISIICLLFLTEVALAQIEFTDVMWSDVLAMSEEKSKPIFVDVYTQWCGPCKKMDATTFQDTAVGDYMNDNFINVKWDADHPNYKSLAKRYGVTGYPTLLYIDYTGNVIKRRTGMHDKRRLMDLSVQVMQFASADYTKLINDLKNNGRPDKDRLVEVLSDFEGFHFTEKENIYDMLFQFYMEQDSVSAEEYHLVVDNLHNTQNLEFAVRHYPISDSNSRRRSVRYRSLIKSKIDRNFEQAIRNNDKDLMEHTADINLVFDSMINRNNRVKNGAFENRDKLLEFYSKHHYKNEYAPLAEEMVDISIAPFTPQMMQQQDEHRQKMKNKIAQKPSTKKLPARAKMLQDHKSAFQMAYRLQIIVDNYAEFYDDDILLEKALSWSELSHAYIDLPENRLSRAKILKKLGYKEEANMHLNKGLSSIYINDKIKNQLIKLQEDLSSK